MMKYAKVVEDNMRFDFVFYEVENREMHIFCPNCGRGRVHPIQHTVKYTKENVTPCGCFEYDSRPPKYCHAGRAWKNLNRVRTAAEFAVENGNVVLNGYDVVAEFGEENYDHEWGNAFFRHPVFNHKLVFRVEFLPNGKLSMKSCITVGMWGVLGRGNWHNVARLSSLRSYDLVEESFEELKMTELEKYIPQMRRFQEAFAVYGNMNTPHTEFTIAFLNRLRSNVAFKKLWSANYDKLCVNRTEKDLAIGYYGYYGYVVYGRNVEPKGDACINWKGKTLEKILKVNIQAADNVIAREDISPSDIESMQILSNNGLAYSKENIIIAHSLAALKTSAGLNGYSFSRAVKYVRNQTKNYKDRDVARVMTEFLDTVRMAKHTQTPMTDDVIFSSNLHNMHEKMVEKDKLLQLSQMHFGFKRIAKAYKMFNITDKEYKIEIIPDEKKLFKYASQLHNCSASYADRIVRNECVLFTITKKGLGLFMLEIDVKEVRIVQNRGLKNERAPEDVLQLSKQWIEQVVKPKWNEAQKALSA